MYEALVATTAMVFILTIGLVIRFFFGKIKNKITKNENLKHSSKYNETKLTKHLTKKPKGIEQRASLFSNNRNKSMSETSLNDSITIDENFLYKQVWNELEENKTDLGLWAKCFATCNGDKTKTEALYLNERVSVLKEKLEKQTNEQKKIKKRLTRKLNSTTKECPSCQLINSEKAKQCDCGYKFT